MQTAILTRPHPRPSHEASGFLAVNKPSGITSFDVIRELRRLLRIKKMGHSGVLDRPASGVLVVGLNSATRLFELFGAFEKEYLADIWLGLKTSTDDLTGELLGGANPAAVSSADFEAALRSYLGELDQIPPAFSLTKKGGRELYRYALAGQAIEAEPKRVEMLDCSLLSFERNIPPAEALNSLGAMAIESKLSASLGQLGPLTRAQVSLRCRGGFYVRSLARDCGADLGVYGAMGSLVRTRVGPFALAQCLSLGQIEERLRSGTEISELLAPLSSIAPQDARVNLDAQQLSLVRSGRNIRRYSAHLPAAAQNPGDLLYGIHPGGELCVLLELGQSLPGGLTELRPLKVIG